MRRLIVIFGVASVCHATALACPNCREAVRDAANATAGGGDLSRGIYLSILLMLGTVIAVAAGLIRLIVVAGRDVAQLPAGAPPAATERPAAL